MPRKYRRFDLAMEPNNTTAPNETAPAETTKRHHRTPKVWSLLSIRIDPSIHQAVINEADTKGCTLRDVIETAIRKYLNIDDTPAQMRNVNDNAT